MGFALDECLVKSGRSREPMAQSPPVVLILRRLLPKPSVPNPILSLVSTFFPLKSELSAVLKTPHSCLPAGLTLWKETELPGIVFRLSSLTITKALIRLDSPSSKGSACSLVRPLCRSHCVCLCVFVCCGGGGVRWISVTAAESLQTAS